MERETHANTTPGGRHPSTRRILYGIGIALIVAGVIAIAATWGGPHPAKAPAWNARVNAVIIYYPTCPHCHALINYLEEKNAFKEFNIVKTTNPAPYVGLLAKMGLKFSGVPTFIVYLPDKNLPAAIKTAPFVVLVGFPSDYQNKDGYFMGKEEDLSYCRDMHGTPYYDRNNYLFCIRPDGTILGNEHAVDWILRQLKHA